MDAMIETKFYFHNSSPAKFGFSPVRSIRNKIILNTETITNAITIESVNFLKYKSSTSASSGSLFSFSTAFITHSKNIFPDYFLVNIYNDEKYLLHNLFFKKEIQTDPFVKRIDSGHTVPLAALPHIFKSIHLKVNRTTTMASNYYEQVSELHGSGIFASTTHSLGDVVFQEKPLYFQQTLANRHDVIICSNCTSFLGNIEFQKDVLKRTISREIICDKVRSNCNHFGSELFLCRHNCGEIYCSKQCADDHFTAGHQHLCTGLIPDEQASTHPLIAFKLHAIETNEVFLMVADVFANLIAKKTSEGVSLEESVSFFRQYVHNPWWEVVTVPKGKKDKDFRGLLKSLATKSYKLLSKALKLKEKKLDKVLSFDFMSRLVNCFI